MTDALEKVVREAMAELELMTAGATLYERFEVEDRVKWVAQAVARRDLEKFDACPCCHGTFVKDREQVGPREFVGVECECHAIYRAIREEWGLTEEEE